MVRIRVMAGLGIGLALLIPQESRGEPFGSYWSTLSSTEHQFVDAVAAGLYDEERGSRPLAYDSLNSASKRRYRARAIEALGVENRPARTKKNGKDI